jgi:hypothetical protein
VEETRQRLLELDVYMLSRRLYGNLWNAAQSLYSPRYLASSAPNTPLNPARSTGGDKGGNGITVFTRDYRLGHIEVLAETFEISECWEVGLCSKPR